MSYETEIFRPTHHPALRRKRFTRRDSWITDPEIEPSDPPTSPFGDNFLSIPQITEDMDDIPTVLDKLRDITAILSRLNWPVPTADGDNNFILYDGVGDGSGLTGIESGGLTWVVKSADYTASGGDGVLCDVSGGSFTVSLPSSPTLGDEVGIKNDGTAPNTVTINRNGNTIENAASNVTLGVNSYRQYVYRGGSDWSLIGSA